MENKKVYQQLLSKSDLSEQQLKSILVKHCRKNCDFADLYLQSISTESWFLEEGIIKEGSFGIEQGFGVRMVVGEKTGFAYSNDITTKNLQQALQNAKITTNTDLNLGKKPKVTDKKNLNHLYPDTNPIFSLSEVRKVGLLRQIDQVARNIDPRVKQVSAVLYGKYELVLIVTDEGRIFTDIRPLVRLDVSVVVEEKGCYEKAHAGGGARTNYQFFLDKDRALNYAREAVRIALLNLTAVAAPAGNMPVVLGPGWPGVLLHEAIGHGLEGDSIRKKSSVFSGKLGEMVAAPICTIVDNGCLEGNRRGSLNVDDEGTMTQSTLLVKNGKLVGFMQDKLNSSLMGVKSTGNGRRESYAHIPIPRMTNSYIEAGSLKPEEIIASVTKGIYAVNFKGGEVDVTSGKFVFSASEAYLIRNGKICEPIKDVTLIGDCATILQKINMVGDDLQLDSGIGSCGKAGQSIPVGVGQPTLKLSELTIGGTFA